MADYPIYRLVKGSELTFAEMDGNLEWLSANISASNAVISGSTLSITSSIVKLEGGPYSGSGALLYDIPSSGVVGLDLSRIASGSATASISPSTGLVVNTSTEISGSLIITGSTSRYTNDLEISGSLTAANITGSLFGTSSWAVSASYAPNLYNTNGSLTANRLVTLDDKQLIYRSSGSALQNYTYTIGIPTGASTRTWPSSIVYEGEFTMPTSTVEPINTRVWARNQTSGFRSFWVNQVFADITGESTGGTSLINQSFVSLRGSQLDTSTSNNGSISGVTSLVGHGYVTTQNSTTTAITSSNVTAYSSNLNNFVGHITNAYGYSGRSQIANSYVANNTRTSSIDNFYNIYLENNVGGNYAPATITNLYSLYITNIVGPSGIVVNRWGLYAPDVLSKHYLNGNLSIGTTETGSFKLLVSGSTRLSGSVQITGSLSVSQNITASNALFTGNISAESLIVRIVSSSIVYSSGSNIFGDDVTDTHSFTGSVNITGSMNVIGKVNAPDITGSLFGTSSWAVTASYALNGGVTKILAGPNITIFPTNGLGEVAISASDATLLNGSGFVSMSGTSVNYVSTIPNSGLTNSSITIQGSSTPLGGSVNVINGTGFVKSTGTTITYDNSTYYLASNPSGYTTNTGTVTSITVSAGTGMSGGGTITTAGTITLTNAAPDQTVVLSNGTGISVTGTYPNFTITNTSPDQTVSLSNGTGISVTGTYPNFTITNTSPDQTVSLTQGGTTVITGTYPNFTITSNDQYTGTVTSVGGTGTVSGLTLTGTVTSTGNLTLGGTLSLTSANVTDALGYTPYNSTNPDGYVSNAADTYTSTPKITNIVTLSAAEYAAIGSPSTSTLYIII